MKKRILACGTFDLLHPGHLAFLKEARTLGDELHVCIARDHNVQRIKGQLPLWPEERRALAVSELSFVDYVHLGAKTDFLQPLKDIQPHILALGYDQKLPCAMEAYLQEHHIDIKRLSPYHPERYKSSLLRDSYQKTKKVTTPS